MDTRTDGMPFDLRAGGASRATTRRDPSLRYYTLVYAGVAGAIAALLWVLDAVVGLSMPGTATSIVAPMVAALMTGQRWAARHGSVPASGTAWRFAAKAAAIVLAVNVAIGLGLLSLTPGGLPVDPSLLALLAAICLMLGMAVVAVNRFFVTYGASSQLRGAR